jgi:hypothetical protein
MNHRIHTRMSVQDWSLEQRWLAALLLLLGFYNISFVQFYLPLYTYAHAHSGLESRAAMAGCLAVTFGILQQSTLSTQPHFIHSSGKKFF